MSDLEYALTLRETAVALTPDDHPSYPQYLTNLGNNLETKAELTGTIDDLNRAITLKEEALSLTPNDHPDRAGYFINLGNCLLTRYKHSNSDDDINRAIATKEQAMKVRTALPIYRVWAAHSASELLKNDAKRSKSLLEAAVYLLPLMSPRALKWKDQQYNLRKVAGLTTKAVSLSLECNEEPYKALELLELGKGVLASLRLDLRSDVTALKSRHETLAQQFEDLRFQLDHRPGNITSPA